MAPELSKDQNCYSNKANVYSLGIMLYVMSVSFLCDINHFLNDDSNFLSIFGDKSSINPSFGENLCNLVFQCLDIDQDKRPTFSQICDNIESNYNNFKFNILDATIQKLKSQRQSFKLKNNE